MKIDELEIGDCFHFVNSDVYYMVIDKFPNGVALCVAEFRRNSLREFDSSYLDVVKVSERVFSEAERRYETYRT